MQKIAVIYCSKYGSTKRYAEWIAEETGAELYAEEECSLGNILDCDTVIYGGAIHAGGIMGIKFIQKNLKRLSGKRLFLFAVGLNVADEENRKQCIEINYKKNMKGIPCYFFRGAYRPSEIAGMDKMLMRVVRKMIEGKKEDEVTEADRELLQAIDQGADYVDRSSIAELVRAVCGETSFRQ